MGFRHSKGINPHTEEIDFVKKEDKEEVEPDILEQNVATTPPDKKKRPTKKSPAKKKKTSSPSKTKRKKTG